MRKKEGSRFNLKRKIESEGMKKKKQNAWWRKKVEWMRNKKEN